MNSTPRAGAALTIAMALVLSAACREAPPARSAESPPAGPHTPAAPLPSATPVPPRPSAATGTLPVPFESEGACPFECCVYRTWTVQRATDVRASRESGAPVAFTLQPGEKVEALTGVVVVTRPGRGRAPRDVAVEGLGALRAGDEVSVLHPLGEGFWLVWREGKKGSAQVGRKPARPGPWDPELYETEAAEFRWWIQIRDGKGRMGWTDAPDNFGNKDRCG